jgi:YD repeat-containing protein
VTSVTDALGGVTSYEYDGWQRRTKITQPDPDGAGPLAAPVTTYVYSAQGGPDKVTDALSRDTTFEYDSMGRRTGITDELGQKTTLAYNNLSQLTSVTQPDPDGTGPLSAPVTSYTIDAYGRVASFTDPLSGVIQFTYDDAGNLLTVTDPVNNTTSYSYDGMGRITIETNANDKTRSYDYDAAGDMTRLTDRNGRVIGFTYDDLSRLTQEKWYTDATPVPTISIATTTEGGPISEVQRVGFTADMIMAGTFTLTYDGQTTATISYNASAAEVQSALEALSNIGSGDVAVTKLQDSSSVQEWRVTFTGALAGTNVVQTTVDSSQIQTMSGTTDIEATDTQGTTESEVQTVTLSNASGGTFRLAYKGETTAPMLHDASAATVETTLEALNAIDQVTVTGSAGGPWTVTFAGTHSGLNVPRMDGDAARLTSGTSIRTIEYVYDAASQITSASDPDSSYAYTYDNLGRVTNVDNNGTANTPRVELSATYDAHGNRTSLAAKLAGTDDFKTSYTFDALHRMTRIEQTGQSGGNAVAEKRIDLAYNAVGLFTEIVRYKDTDGGSTNEVATAGYSYDSLGRITGLSFKQGGNNLFTAYAWTYDHMNRVTQLSGQDGTSDYSYDSTGV